MIKKTILSFCILFSILSYGQENILSDEQLNLSGASKVEFADGDDEIRKLAKSDIENHTPFLLLRGGMNQLISPSDQEFERKFKIYFFNYGCIAPSEAVESIYNQVVFEFLYLKYGKKWMKEIRKDISGFKKFKKAIQK
ncbi:MULTISPECIES: FEKKY domain-containing protein [Flavobacterium]|uniref:Uncharacterized protein n=1 Tax=Flavobacterium salmonis TaxID=2654844 RepID=A0A6V6YVK0_9FLAO|nr:MULTISPECIES: hypothetical protein [Flavobacterium]OOV17103.1 hypothetical protein BXU10_19350 [Flavobacterium sp. LM4]CAD0003426.1 hypothetical protein FLAT13_01693 [Flavobacterium salmonis]